MSGLTVEKARRMVHRIVDRRIDERVPRGITRPIRGTVAEVFPASFEAMVRLRGSTTAVRVPYAMLPDALLVGDEVVVDQGPDGWVMLAHVLGRDVDSSDVPQGLPRVVVRASGGDDAPAISAAVRPGVVIELPDPLYYNLTGILVNADNCFIVGSGGAYNPAADASTIISGTGEFVWDKSPGLDPQLEDSPQHTIKGGGMSHVVLLSKAASAGGLRIGPSRWLTFSDMTVAGFAVNIATDNHGTPPGGSDAYDHITALTFTRVQSIVTTGIGFRLDGNAWSCTLEDCTVTVTSSGTGISLLGVDDVMIVRSRVLVQQTTGVSLRMTGGDYGGGKAPTACQIVQSYFNGPGRKIVVAGNTYDFTPRRNLFLIGTEEGAVTWTADKGSMPSFIDTDGWHNLKLHGASTATFEDDFGSGTLVSTTVGALGWSQGGGTLTRIAPVASHPGIVNLDTSSSSGTLSRLYIPDGATHGILVPSEGFDAEFIFRLNHADTDTMCRIGFGLSPTADPPDNGIYLEKLYGDTSWYAVCRTGGSSQTRSSAIAAVGAGSWVRLRIRRHNSTTIGISVGDTTMDNDTRRLTANIPTATLAAMFQVKNQAAASKTLDVDRFQLHITGMSR